jgi:hypothetical protein
MEATSMDVDHDDHEQTTPLGSPFGDGYTSYAGRGAPPSAVASVQTENFFIPLYTESQETGHTAHTTVNTN